MSENEERIDSTTPKAKIHTLIDVPYPRKIWDKIRKGEEIDFQELVKTGMVMAFITPYDDELESIVNHVKDWANKNKTAHVFVNPDDDQKFLNRFLEINRNNDRIDYAGLNQLFEKICLYSSVFSIHQDEEHPTLISLKTRIITFHSGKYRAYYIAISSHPDLIDEERLKQLIDQSSKRFEEITRKRETGESTPNPDQQVIYSPTFNITIQNVNNSNLQFGTVNSNQTLQQNDLHAITNLITKLESTIETLENSHKEKIMTQIQSIKDQTKSQSPNKQIIVDGLKSIREILQSIPSAQSAITAIISNLDPVLKSLGMS